MKNVGSVTDQSYYEPFIGIEPTATFKIWFRICRYCDEAYETHRERQAGPAKGMASIAPKHRCRQQAWHDLSEDIKAGRISMDRATKMIKEILR